MTLTEAQIPSHSHTLRAEDPSAGAAGASTDQSSLARSFQTFAYQTNTSANLVDMAGEKLSTTGGGQAHTNVQPYLTLNFIIALVGLYPSRS